MPMKLLQGEDRTKLKRAISECSSAIITDTVCVDNIKNNKYLHSEVYLMQ